MKAHAPYYVVAINKLGETIAWMAQTTHQARHDKCAETWKDCPIGVCRGAVPLREALIRFKAWLPYSGNEPLAHTAEFDEDFIEAAEEQAGFKTYLKKSWHCSRKLFMGVNTALELNAPNFKLVTLATMAGHWAPDYQRGAHQSLDDVLACAAGWRWMMMKIRAGLELPRLQVALREAADAKTVTEVKP